MEGKRNKELNFEFERRKKLPRIKNEDPYAIASCTRLLYSKLFQVNMKRSMAACAMMLEGNNE